MISDFGIKLHDGISKLQIEKIKDGDASNLRVTMQEGRNRQIRRTFSSLGYTVTGLNRTAFGEHVLGDLAAGTVKLLQ